MTILETRILEMAMYHLVGTSQTTHKPVIKILIKYQTGYRKEKRITYVSKRKLR